MCDAGWRLEPARRACRHGLPGWPGPNGCSARSSAHRSGRANLARRAAAVSRACTGRLAVRATSPYGRAPWEQQWRESKAGSLPGKVSEMVRTLEQEAPGLAERVREAERERQRQEEEFRRWEAEERERRRLERIKRSREEFAGGDRVLPLRPRLRGLLRRRGAARI